MKKLVMALMMVLSLNMISSLVHAQENPQPEPEKQEKGE